MCSQILHRPRDLTDPKQAKGLLTHPKQAKGVLTDPKQAKDVLTDPEQVLIDLYNACPSVLVTVYLCSMSDCVWRVQ